MTTAEYALSFALVGLVALQIRGFKVTKAALVFPVVMTLWVATALFKSIPTGAMTSCSRWAAPQPVRASAP